MLKDEDLGPLVSGSRRRSAAQDQRRAAVRQSRRHLAAQATGGDSHPESVPGRRLRADVHRSGHHGGRQRGGPARGQRILEHSGSDAPPCRLWDLHEPELLEPWRANDRVRYQQGLPWDDTGVRLGLSALAALHRGATALETSIVNAVSSAMHVEDLLSYIRTGESRSELIQRLTSGPAAPSGELLRAFAALAVRPAARRSRWRRRRWRRSPPRGAICRTWSHPA